MSKYTGKATATAKKPGRTTRRGEHQLEKQALDLQNKADHLLHDKVTHSSILTIGEASDIQTSIDQLELQANRLKDASKARERTLEIIHEQSHKSSSEDEEEGEETNSRLGSGDTMPYLNTYSSPLQPSLTDKSPQLGDQTPLQRLHKTPPVNPQFNFNLPPALPSGSATLADPMAVMQSMFAQQALANNQQQEAMMAHQTLISSQQAETNQQLQLLLAKSLDRQIDHQDKQLQQQDSMFQRQAIADARLAIKHMKEGCNIVQYLEHFESELEEAHIPPAKWKKILVGKLSTKADKVCAHLINDQTATYDDIKRYLLANIGPSMDELCNIVHGAYHSEFQDKTEAQKLQHSKYLAERYFLGSTNKEEHLAVR